MRTHPFIHLVAITTVLVTASAVLRPATTQAQCMGTNCRAVSADVKGTLAGGIIGAELGFIIPALIVSAGARELDEPWAWIIFPVIGAAGGAVAGYFIFEDPSRDAMGNQVPGYAEAAVATLAVSMALIVPTFVGVLALTSYSPGASSGDEGGGASGDEDASEDGGGGGGDSTETSAEQARNDAVRRTLAGGPGLFRLSEGQLLLGVPMVRTTDTYTAEEREHMQMMLPASADLQVPLVSGVF